MRSPALITPHPRAGCHAVLAFLSKRYPPLEGRSPTCYSPVCHSTQGRSPFRVRLACVRHAASVDSEPGSNSQVKGVGPPVTHLRTSRTDTTLQRRAPVDMAHSRCSVRQVIGGSPPARAGELHPTTRTAERHPLITRRVVLLTRSIQFSKNRAYPPDLRRLRNLCLAGGADRWCVGGRTMIPRQGGCQDPRDPVSQCR